METKILNDENIKTQIWAGYIPVVFNVRPEDVTALQAPFPYYVCVDLN